MGLFDRFRPRPFDPPLVPLAEFLPVSPLEEALLAACRSSSPSWDGFIQGLASEKLFLAGHQPAGGGFAPLWVEPKTGRMIVAFTAPVRHERVKDVLPPVEAGMLVDATWIVSNVPEGLGLWINPGWEANLQLLATAIDQLRG